PRTRGSMTSPAGLSLDGSGPRCCLRIYSPLIVISVTRRVTPAPPPGSQVRSEPISPTSSRIRWRVDALVTSRTGSANLTARTSRPSAPTEKSPLTGFVPECRPLTDCTYSADGTEAMISSGPRAPGSGYSARAPTPGVDLNPPRTADPV